MRANLESTGLADSLSYWVFTDVFEESSGGATVFHGGFGLINFQGIVKPTFHAYRFLRQLGDRELGRTPGVIATKDGASGAVQVLAYHYPSELREAPPMTKSPAEAEKILALGQSRDLSVDIQGLSPHASLLMETLDDTHGFALPAWKAMGAPEPPSREETALLRQAARHLKQEFFTADDQGRFSLKRTISPWSVVMIRKIRENDSVIKA